LFQDRDARTPEPGVVLYLPVFRHGAAIGTLAERRAAILGVLFMGLHTRALIEGLLPPADRAVTNVFDSEHPDPLRVLYSIPQAKPSRSAIEAVHVLRAGGRSWLVQIKAEPRSLAEHRRDSTLVAAFAFLSALLLFGVMVSITRTRNHAQKLARAMTARLEAKQAELEQAQESAPVGVYVLSADGRRVTYANAKACEITGMDLQCPTEFSWAQHLHPEDRDAALKAWTQACESGRAFEHEHRLLRPDR
jgi:PAS domain-containing protein